MKKLLVLAALAAALLVCPDAHAQLAQRASTLQNAMGRAVPQASITVCAYDASQYALVQQTYSLVPQYVWTYTGTVPCTPALTMYNDPGGAHAITPPLLTSGNGNYTYWIAPNVYTECVKGTQIIANCYVVNIGGSGGGILLETNGVTNSVQNILNLAGSVTNAAGTTTISGCAVTSLLDTWVLSIHPNATCFGSADWTWDDGPNEQNMQAGLSNVIDPGSSMTFELGDGNTTSEASDDAFPGDVFLEGIGNTNAGSDNYAYGEYNLMGTAGQPGVDDVVSVGLVNSVQDGSDQVFLFGQSMTITGDPTSHNNGPQNLMMGSTGYSPSDATVAHNTTTAHLTGLTAFGDDNHFTGNGNASDLLQDYVYGASNTLETTANLSELDYAHVVGSENTLTSPTASQTMGFFQVFGSGNTESGYGSDVETIGDNNTLTGAVSNGGMFGNSLALGPCTSCYLFGESGILAASNTIGIGLSATPEIQITPGQVKMPTIAAYTSAANGEIGYDTTNKNWHVGANGVDNFVILAPSAAPPTNGDCAIWSVVGAVVKLGDSGSPGCTGGGGGGSAFSAITSGTNAIAAMGVGTGASLTPTGTGVISANQLLGLAVPTLAAQTGFLFDNAGTLALSADISKFTVGVTTEARLPAATVFTDASATFAAHTYDFSGVTLLKLRVGAGLTTSANGDFGFDSTNGNWHGWNGADLIFAPLASGFVSGHCGQPTSSAGKWTVVDTGLPCGTATSAANLALSNLASVAINVSLTPAAVNTVDLGTSLLPWRNFYGGTAANKATMFDFSANTANHIITWPDKGGTPQMNTDTINCSQMPVVSSGDVTNSAGSCPKTVAAISGVSIGLTTPASGQTQSVSCTGGNSPVCTNTAPQQAENPQTGTTYLIAPSDLGRLVKRSNSGAMTDTIPDPSTANFGQGFYFTLSNSGNGATDGGGGIITLSRGSSAVFNIDGNPSITKTAIQIGPRQKCVFVAPDTSNWDVWCNGFPSTFGVQYVHDFTGMSGSLGSTTMLTPTANGSYRFSTPIVCTAATATTVVVTLSYTDVSGTVQTLTSSSVNCTTLGSASVGSFSGLIRAMAGDPITISTTAVGSTYTISPLLEGPW